MGGYGDYCREGGKRGGDAHLRLRGLGEVAPVHRLRRVLRQRLSKVLVHRLAEEWRERSHHLARQIDLNTMPS